MTGAVTGATGTDTIIFSGAGSAAFTPTAFEYTAEDGAGTFTIAGLPTMQRLEIRRGTLHVNSAYEFLPYRPPPGDRLRRRQPRATQRDRCR